MTILASTTIQLSVSCTRSVLAVRPSITEAEINAISYLTNAVWREGGTTQTRWGTVQDGIVAGEEGGGFFVLDRFGGKSLYAEQRFINARGVPATDWIRSNVVDIPVVVTPPVVWQLDGSLILSHPPAPPAPTITLTSNGALVSA